MPKKRILVAAIFFVVVVGGLTLLVLSSQAQEREGSTSGEMVDFVWEASYTFVDEENGNHVLNHLVMFFPAPTVNGHVTEDLKEGLNRSPGSWEIYSPTGDVVLSSESLTVSWDEGIREWRWSETKSESPLVDYNGYADRCTGEKLLYSLRGVFFEKGMTFRARHEFAIPVENVAGLTLKDLSGTPEHPVVENRYTQQSKADVFPEITSRERLFIFYSVRLYKKTDGGLEIFESHEENASTMLRENARYWDFFLEDL